LVTKKGIALTAAIIGGFTAASFLVYFVPSAPQGAVVVPTDPATELAFAMDRNQAIVDDFQSTFEMWKNNELNKDEFNKHADAAVNQVNELMLELRRSDAPEEWVQSYVLYIQALENYKEYFAKTKEYVSNANSDPSSKEALLNSASELLAKAQSLQQQSQDATP
jgi:hypothetical protein